MGITLFEYPVLCSRDFLLVFPGGVIFTMHFHLEALLVIGLALRTLTT